MCSNDTYTNIILVLNDWLLEELEFNMMMMVINAAMYCVCFAWVITGKCQTLNMFCCFVQKGNTLVKIPYTFLQANTSP